MTPTFIDAPRATDLAALDADVAILGVPHGLTYDLATPEDASAAAPATIRQQSRRLVARLRNFDWEYGGDLLAGREVRIVDCGDVSGPRDSYPAYQRAVTDAVRAIVGRGAVPLVLGGNDAIPIPVLRAYAEGPPFCLVQIDAHIDWRDEVNGIREGYSSPMRRAAEMPWVQGMAQIGMRGTGSARQQEVDAARAHGSVMIRAEEVHEAGVAAALARIPAAARYFITFDADGLDPAIAPGVGSPMFGGLTYFQATNLLKGVASRGRIVGCDFVEVVPALDPHGLTSLMAARLVLNLIGAMAHAGQIGR